MAAVLRELLEHADAGNLAGFAFLAETMDAKVPIVGIEGRWRADPVRLLGELEILKTRVARLAADERYGT